MGMVVWHGNTAKTQLLTLFDQKLAVAAEVVRARALELMKEPKSGTMGKISRQSAPGEAPAVQTSRLANSINVYRSFLHYRVGTNVKYGMWLELGTTGGRLIKPIKARALSWIDYETGQRRFAKQVVMQPMLARPYLRPALRQSKSKIEMIMGLGVRITTPALIKF